MNERLEVNAALAALIAGEWDEPAHTVIRYGYQLRKSQIVGYEGVDRTKKSNGLFSGQTENLGEIKFGTEEPQKLCEKSWGTYKERIGQYRVWKEREGHILFHHFWKSGISTQASTKKTPDTYYLGYDPTTLKPEFLAIRRTQKVLPFKFFSFRLVFEKYYLEAIHGVAPKLSHFLDKSTTISWWWQK